MRKIKGHAILSSLISIVMMMQMFVPVSADDIITVESRDSYIDENGNHNLRFITRVDFTEEQKEVTKFGTWIVPEDFFTNEGIGVTVQNTEDASKLNNGGTFTADIMGIPAVHKDMKFYAKSFIEYGGNTEWSGLVYTDANYDDKTTAVNKVSELIFKKAFPNTDTYLYRVGNANTVSLSSLFKSETTPSDVKVTIDNIAGSASGEYKANTTAWDKGTIQFTGEGVVKVIIRDGNGAPTELYLEVVDGKNATTAASATSQNVVLLNDVLGGASVYNGYTLYGNGFKIEDPRNNNPSGNEGFITINNGSLNNVQIIGYEPAGYAYTTSAAGAAPAVNITGNAEIYNSYIYGGRHAVRAASGNVTLKNTLIDGGSLGNMEILNANVTLENCITTTSTRGKLKGLGIRIEKLSAKLTINGYLKQYNWVKNDDLPDAYKPTLSKEFNSDVAFKYDGTNYIDVGIVFAEYETSFTSDAVMNIITDNRENRNKYKYHDVNIGAYSGVLYTATEGDPEMLGKPSYTPSSQDYTLPSTEFDYTKQKIDRTEGSNLYCFYEDTTDTVKISFDKTREDTTFEWNPMILTVKKFGGELPYTVTMNDTDYTDKNISFGESGDYTVTYTYTDPYNYDKDGNSFEVLHTETVNISVIAIEPDEERYETEFSYAGDWESNAKKVVINNKTYVMPDITDANETTFGSTTVGDQTVYYPIVTVKASNKGDSKDYESGDIYYYIPVFNAINIKDINQDDGTEYTYNKDSKKWPRYEDPGVGPDADVFTYTAGGADIYNGLNAGSSGKSTGFSNRKGLCYVGGGFNSGPRGGATNLTEYLYRAYDGTTYYWYIKYELVKQEHVGGGCFAEGTLITMADGSQEPIEDVTASDKVLAWDFTTGTYTESDLALLISREKREYKVSNLIFSDGTVLRIIAGHGVFDYDLNRFVVIDDTNCTQFVGHRFVQNDKNGGYNVVTLENAYVTEEKTAAYSLNSAGTMNVFASGLLTVPPPDDFYNWMPMCDKLRYDMAAFEADVQKYGLYTYDDFKDYVTYEQFVAFNGAYLKIPVEKGIFSFEYILELIDLYVK